MLQNRFYCIHALLLILFITKYEQKLGKPLHLLQPENLTRNSLSWHGLSSSLNESFTEVLFSPILMRGNLKSINLAEHLTLRASSIVSGSFCPSVLGKKTATTPAMVATTPMMKTGAGSQYPLSRSSRREVMPPILATRSRCQLPGSWWWWGTSLQWCKHTQWQRRQKLHVSQTETKPPVWEFSEIKSNAQNGCWPADPVVLGESTTTSLWSHISDKKYILFESKLLWYIFDEYTEQILVYYWKSNYIGNQLI